MIMSKYDIKNTDLALTAFLYGLTIGLETGTAGAKDVAREKARSIVTAVSKLAPYKGIAGDNASLYAPRVKGITESLRAWDFLEGPDNKGIISAEKIGAVSDEDQQRLDILAAIHDAIKRANRRF